MRSGMSYGTLPRRREGTAVETAMLPLGRNVPRESILSMVGGLIPLEEHHDDDNARHLGSVAISVIRVRVLYETPIGKRSRRVPDTVFVAFTGRRAGGGAGSVRAVGGWSSAGS